MTIAIIFFTWCATIAAVWLIVSKAPLGFEDDDGFHYGDEHADDDNRGI